ncbi:hypothetical protein [Hymenobacter sp. YC55]|uniref:hypothetical protein n=1 Tax=Hymenobacter sp. YC55 TaxID=3034019 RepID=UPI0023F74A2C|nr:hypothetical protein [Hymenobacter sp. YC55]MDF7814834.1 hypothetical protein [Hymenobacter sp. YC55]
MFQQFFRFLGNLYTLVWGFLLTALLGVAVLVAWHFYQEEVFQTQLRSQGEPVTVQVNRADRTHRALWDVLGTAVYIGFTHHNRAYETRYVSDTLWLSEGDRVTLLYHPPSDRFGQLQRAPTTPDTRVVSRLIDWSVLADFSRESKSLGLLVLLALALFFVGGGLVVRVTGLTFIQTIARALLVVVMGAMALFISYDAYQYYQYGSQLKRNGQRMDVTVMDTDRLSHGRKYHWYTYQATFLFKNQQRVVAITEAEYGRLNAGATQLAVLYDPTPNDFVAADYSLSISPVGAALFCWLMLFLLLRPTPAKPAAVQPNRL